MENTTAFIEITAILTDYFDGIYEGNTEKLDRVFHPEGQLSCVTDGYLNLVNKTKYLEIVANREPPESKGSHRYDKIISINMAGPETALAKVECAIPPRYFTDLLTLIKLDGKWMIINKTYHYVEHG